MTTIYKNIGTTDSIKIYIPVLKYTITINTLVISCYSF